MAKQEFHLSFTFENPNRDDVFERVLRQMLIEKLAAEQRDEGTAA